MPRRPRQSATARGLTPRAAARADSRDVRLPGARPVPKKVGRKKLRIAGGDLRGRNVTYHGADFTRPMKDVVRESVFNVLGASIRGAVAVDLFSGTGILAVEAVSRGAASAIAVEAVAKAGLEIKKSVEKLGVADRIRVVIADAFRVHNKLVPDAAGARQVLMVCPPYRMWSDPVDRKSLIEVIENFTDRSPPGSVLVIETERRFDFSLLPDGDWDERFYGGTRLAFLEQPAV